MPPRRLLLIVAAHSILLAGCGYVGDPLPPLANIPKPPASLAALQRGGRLIVQFELPARTTEEVEIRVPLEVELRVAGERFTRGDIDQRAARYEIPSARFEGRQVAISVRVSTPYGKQSDWVEMTLPVVPAPPTPVTRAESHPSGARLSWSGPPGRFRVLKRGPDEKAFTTAARVDALEWVDEKAEFGRSSTYMVQRVVDLGGGREAESELPAEVSVTPRDTFPPSAPAGLRAVGSSASIELVWDRSPEPDVTRYRIYRAPGDGPFQQIAEVTETPAYSDRSVAENQPYRYQVTAVDQAQNESPRSTAVQATR